MTPEAWRRRLGPHRPAGRHHDLLGEAELAREPLRQHLDAHPADGAALAAYLAVLDVLGALSGVPAQLGGVRIEEVVRWDDVSVTVDGTRLADASPFRLRVVRSDRRGDALVALRFAAETRALLETQGGITQLDSDWPHGAVALDGMPFAVDEEDDEVVPAEFIGRALASGLLALGERESAGLGVPELVPADFVDEPAGLRLVVLSAGGPLPPSEAVRPLARWLAELPHRGGPLADVLSILASEPASSVGDAASRCVQALASDLAARRHAVSERWVATAHARRKARLTEALDRLIAAVPAPLGRGALGVDLDGSIIALVSTPEGLSLETPGGRAALTKGGVIVDAPAARRALRIQASAPRSAHLDAQVQGQPGFADAATRWLASALRLRTLKALLQHGQSTGGPTDFEDPGLRAGGRS